MHQAALLGCSTIVLADRISISTRASMQHCWAVALFKLCWLFVVAAALTHRCNIIGLQHSSKYEPCWCWLLVVAAALIHHAAKLTWYTDLFQHAGCSFSSNTMHPCSIIGLQHFLGRAGCLYWQWRSCELCWLLVLAATLMKLAWYTDLFQLAGCSYWQQHPYIHATLLGCSTFWVVLAARIGSGCCVHHI